MIVLSMVLAALVTTSYAAPVEAPPSHTVHAVRAIVSSPVSGQHATALYSEEVINDAAHTLATGPSSTGKRNQVQSLMAPVQTTPAKRKRPIRSSRAYRQTSPHSNAKPTLTSKNMTSAEKTRLRRDRARKLELHPNSPLPMFSHSLTDEQLIDHPDMKTWQGYYEALKKGSIQQSQLPILMQTMRGDFKFMQKEKPAQQEEPSKNQRMRRMYDKARFDKAEVLGIALSSALPQFALGHSAEEIRDHPLIDSWLHHRTRIIQGTLKQEDLPKHFSSREPGRLVFKKGASNIRDKDKKPVQPRQYTGGMKKQRKDRYYKLKALGLGRGSAVPLFAQKLTAENVKEYEGIDSWNHHRTLLEQGKITEQQLPQQFKSYDGNKLRGRHRLGARQPSLEADCAQHSQITSDTTPHHVESPQTHLDSDGDSDPFAFLHTMPLD